MTLSDPNPSFKVISYKSNISKTANPRDKVTTGNHTSLSNGSLPLSITLIGP